MLKNLKKLRGTMSVTQKQLADAIGVSQQSINKYENHKIEPDIATLIQIAEYFHTSVDYLIGHTEDPECAATHVFELNKAEEALLLGYRKLSRKKQDSIDRIIELYNE